MCTIQKTTMPIIGPMTITTHEIPLAIESRVSPWKREARASDGVVRTAPRMTHPNALRVDILRCGELPAWPVMWQSVCAFIDRAFAAFTNSAAQRDGTPVCFQPARQICPHLRPLPFARLHERKSFPAQPLP